MKGELDMEENRNICGDPEGTEQEGIPVSEEQEGKCETEMVPMSEPKTEDPKTEDPEGEEKMADAGEKKNTSYSYGHCSDTGYAQTKEQFRQEEEHRSYERNEAKSMDYEQNYAYNTNMDPRHQPEEGLDASPMTMGDWLLTILAAMIPCCGGIILYCYWAFSKNGNINRRNYCRAALIVEGVGIIILFVFFILVTVMGGISGYSNYYYGY